MDESESNRQRLDLVPNTQTRKENFDTLWPRALQSKSCPLSRETHRTWLRGHELKPQNKMRGKLWMCTSIVLHLNHQLGTLGAGGLPQTQLI